MATQMQTQSGSLLQGARVVRDTGLWLAKWAARAITAPVTGICPVCNNLQPRGHEDTLGRTPNSLGRYIRHEGRQQRADAVQEAALTLTNIKTKELLRCRDINPTTGQPHRDCRYCRLLCDILDAFFIDEYMSWITDTRNGMHLVVGLMIREGHPLIINCSGCFTYDKYLMHPRVDLEVFCETYDTLHAPGAPTMGFTLPRVMDTRDPSCMAFARDCMQECLQQHPGCRPTPSNFVPTRLLYLGANDSEIRLCEYLPAPVSWAALSHCWGGSDPLKLKTANRPTLIVSIEFDSLPPTFRDAIQVCRSLSIPYLWIDSLCILQDSSADWEYEASQMQNVYMQASLVLVAASSAKPEVPFLGPRDEQEWATKTFSFETPHGAVIPTLARRRHLLAPPLDQGVFEPPFTDAWSKLKRAGPLYRRGWCFQESYLARRALHFAPASLIYECTTHRRSQDTPGPPHPVLTPGTLGEVISDAAQWRAVIESYTSRQLTFGSDKLPAIAGVAAAFMAQQQPRAKRGRYLAGLWEETLLGDLMWHVMPTSDRSTTVMTYPQETRKAAPSWSWASINHGVVWNHFASFEPLACVIEASCTVKGVNPLGAVEDGRIEIRGVVTPCRVRHDSHNRQHFAYFTGQDGRKSTERWFLGDGCLIPVASEHAAAVASNVIAQRAVPEKAYYDGMRDFDASAAVMLVARTGRWNYNHVGLVVALSESKPGCLERIGSITNLGSEWYDQGQECMITLV